MLEKYRAVVENLLPDQAIYLTEAVRARTPDAIPDPVQSGRQLWDSLGSLDQADLVMSLARDNTVTGVQVIETLVGKPIVRQRPADRAAAGRQPRAPRLRVEVRDDRVIEYVGPNPKKPGSATHERYKLYEVGRTIGEVMTLGVTSADVKWDTERGFIRLREGI